MDETVKAIFFLLAVVCFLVATLEPLLVLRQRIALVPLGLLLFVFPFMWDAFEAA